MAQAATIKDFLVALGFKTDNAGLAKMQGALQGVELKAKSLNMALGALAVGAVLAVRQTASELDKLYFSSKRIGASAENINAYGNAISQMGGSAEDAIGTLESLAEKMRNSPGYEGMINSLGVKTKDSNGALRDRVEVMKDLSTTLAKMPSYQANAYANSLGIDQKTLLAMRDDKFIGNMEKYQKIQKELGMNDKLVKSGNDFMSEYRDLSMITKTGFQVIVMQVGKALIPVLKGLNHLVLMGVHAFSQMNPKIKEGLVIGLRFALLATVFSSVARAFGLFLRFIAPLKFFIRLLGLLRLAFLATPLGIIAALAAGILALYDDYKTWKEGGKSFLDWSQWTKEIDWVTQKIKDFMDLLSRLTGKAIEFVQKIVHDPKGALKDIKDGTVHLARDFINWTRGTAHAAVGGMRVLANMSNGSYSSVAPIKSGAKKGKQVEFIKKYWPAAVKIAQALNTRPEFLLAQFAGETDWGRKVIDGTGFNLGNIKASKDWGGKTVRAWDKAEKSYDPYKVYSSADDFADDYIKLVGNSSRYKKVVGKDTALEFFSELKKSGYATDPSYVSKNQAMVKSINKRLDLSQNKTSSSQFTTVPLNNIMSNNNVLNSISTTALNPYRDQLNNASLASSKGAVVTVNQSFNTDMTINGAKSPQESANAVKRQQENSLVIARRNAQSVMP